MLRNMLVYLTNHQAALEAYKERVLPELKDEVPF